MNLDGLLPSCDFAILFMANTAQTQPHFQFTCADPITNGVLYYKVFLCHVDLQTASRDERWPIKTLLYHSSAHKYCVLSASVMCHLRLHACLILQQAMLSGYGTFVMYSNFMPHTPLLTKGCYWRAQSRGFFDVATTNVCKVDTSNRNHRWMKLLITGLRLKKHPFRETCFGRRLHTCFGSGYWNVFLTWERW